MFSHSNRFFNDTELKNSTKHKIEVKQNVFSLTVNKADHPDVGVYRAHVDNGIDQTDQTAKLNVGGKIPLIASRKENTFYSFSSYSETKSRSC